MRYDDTVRVLGIDEIAEFVQSAHDHNGEESETDIEFACIVHMGSGMSTAYDTSGVLVISCHKCKRVVAQIEVAPQGRTIPMRYKN